MNLLENRESDMNVYADADFLLALLKPDDWLKESAEKIFVRYKEIWTSEAAILEVMFYIHNHGLDAVKYAVSLLDLIKVKNINPDLIVQAAYYMKHEGVNPADSIHASYAIIENIPIISSDDVYDKLGISRIKLEKLERS